MTIFPKIQGHSRSLSVISLLMRTAEVVVLLEASAPPLLWLIATYPYPPSMESQICIKASCTFITQIPLLLATLWLRLMHLLTRALGPVEESLGLLSELSSLPLTAP